VNLSDDINEAYRAYVKDGSVALAMELAKKYGEPDAPAESTLVEIFGRNEKISSLGILEKTAVFKMHVIAAALWMDSAKIAAPHYVAAYIYGEAAGHIMKAKELLGKLPAEDILLNGITVDEFLAARIKEAVKFRTSHITLGLLNRENLEKAGAISDFYGDYQLVCLEKAFEACRGQRTEDVLTLVAELLCVKRGSDILLLQSLFIWFDISLNKLMDGEKKIESIGVLGFLGLATSRDKRFKDRHSIKTKSLMPAFASNSVGLAGCLSSKKYFDCAGYFVSKAEEARMLIEEERKSGFSSASCKGGF
jgi:hypothetical protein